MFTSINQYLNRPVHPVRSVRGVCAGALLAMLLLLCPVHSVQSANALAECRALSDNPDDIHVCLDNYLGDLDNSMSTLSNYIEEQLDGDVLVSFQRAQLAFADYRRENCLWYLEFAAPRDVADQLAKNCLSDMTSARLAELQNLLVQDNAATSGTLSGYYVYGADRNTFEPCGSNQRYWVDGERSAVGQLQQDYVQIMTTERQRLYVVLQGELVDEPQNYPGHDGSVALTDVNEVRVPTDTDCPIPGTAASPPVAEVATGALVPLTDGEPDEEVASIISTESEQELRAYFGDWRADCLEREGRYACRVSAGLTDPSPTLVDQAVNIDSSQPRLSLIRTPEAITRLELLFPNRVINADDEIRWQIDNVDLGVMDEATLQIEDTNSTVLLNDSSELQEQLVPDLKAGLTLRISVMDASDTLQGSPLEATLIGLTRALAFADDFVTGATP